MALLSRLSLVTLLLTAITWTIPANAKPPKLCYCPCPTPPVINLKAPNIEPVGLLNWVRDAAVMSFHYDYNNVNKWLAQYSLYFDARGWFHYYQALKNSGNMMTVWQNKMTVTSTPLEPPTVIWEGVDLGVYKWRVQMPLLVQYRTETGNTVQQKLMVNMSLRRTDDSMGKNGIAIERFVAKPI